ncbi:uncharacterized protein LOC143854705 [Tasmannia lanceolata]|uniref:uncharacterized protein LOC143854705 n=1 Tax=Tasmannia lanceolata TaxID=3420 RepID=UPI004064C7F7
MGGSCCKLRRDYGNEPKYADSTLGHCVKFHRKPTRGRIPVARTSRNQVLSSNQDAMYSQGTQNGQSIGSHKSDRVRSQERRFNTVNSGGSGTEGIGSLNILKRNDETEPSADCKHERLGASEKPTSIDSLLPITNDEDFCPTCLDGYDKENPKIITKCKHHFHLSCILEWMERSDTCPICDQEMVFDETS